jgi:hypothetical protein
MRKRWRPSSKEACCPRAPASPPPRCGTTGRRAPMRRRWRITAPSPSTSGARAGPRSSSSTPRTSPSRRMCPWCASSRRGRARPATSRCSSPRRWMTPCGRARTSSRRRSTASSLAPGRRRAAASSPSPSCARSCHEGRGCGGTRAATRMAAMAARSRMPRRSAPTPAGPPTWWTTRRPSTAPWGRWPS